MPSLPLPPLLPLREREREKYAIVKAHTVCEDVCVVEEAWEGSSTHQAVRQVRRLSILYPQPLTGQLQLVEHQLQSMSHTAGQLL